MFYEEPFEGMEPGDTRFYKTKLKRGGDFVAACIWFRDGDYDEHGDLCSDQTLGATFDGIETNDYEKIAMRFPYMEKIEEPEYRYLLDLAQWKRENPEEPKPKKAKKPVDFNTMELPF